MEPSRSRSCRRDLAPIGVRTEPPYRRWRSPAPVGVRAKSPAIKIRCGVQQDHGCYCDPPGGADLLIEARQWSEFGLCRSPGGVLFSVEVVGGVRLQQLILRSEPGSRRSPGGAVLLSMAEPGSRRSPGGAVLLSAVEPGSRRSPGGAVLLSAVEPSSCRSPGGAVPAIKVIDEVQLP